MPIPPARTYRRITRLRTATERPSRARRALRRGPRAVGLKCKIENFEVGFHSKNQAHDAKHQSMEGLWKGHRAGSSQGGAGWVVNSSHACQAIKAGHPAAPSSAARAR